MRQSNVVERQVPALLLQHRVVISGRHPVREVRTAVLEVRAAPGTQTLRHGARQVYHASLLRRRDEDPSYPRFLSAAASIVSLAPEGGAAPDIDVVRVPERKTLKNRLHLDLRADGSTQRQEVERLIGLGARRVDIGQGPDVSWVVLADPEGNEFCVLSRSVQDLT